MLECGRVIGATPARRCRGLFNYGREDVGATAAGLQTVVPTTHLVMRPFGDDVKALSDRSRVPSADELKTICQ
ncbi:hypothetical protein O3G_MSEX009347 [Manduca sexta]|uniref:Uncharacterized protein n=1 Tax=Manduca sexta TaxID=7130 RepID=A0A921ZE22_MANSE|nr:hypothetical protein O3G_MSEX009347 [Manduca sexta]